jgi:trans-aconitate 2-methyltransferase
MPSDAWSPAQYERFRQERSRPFFDLLSLVRAKAGMHVVDLGCGTGELTGALHTKLAAKSTLGIDSSEAMLARSVGYASPGLSFEKGDIGEVAAALPKGQLDLVFSNAALHWLPSHAELLARLAAALAPGGQLAVQVPANYDHPSHLLAAKVASEAPFVEALAGHVHRNHVLLPEQYAARLFDLGFVEQRVRLEVYAHELASRDDIVEWVKGTLLTEYAARMPDALYAEFFRRFRASLLDALPDRRPCLYAFKRILFWGVLSEST